MSYKAFRVGPLAALQINKALGLELDAGDVWVSRACHRHIAVDHPGDYPHIKANIIDIIREPMWVGQDPKHADNIYLIRRLPTRDAFPVALVAIGLEMTQHGNYNVRSAYRIKQEDVDTRILHGSLKRILPE